MGRGEQGAQKAIKLAAYECGTLLWQAAMAVLRFLLPLHCDCIAKRSTYIYGLPSTVPTLSLFPLSAAVMRSLLLLCNQCRH